MFSSVFKYQITKVVLLQTTKQTRQANERREKIKNKRVHIILLTIFCNETFF